MTQGRAHKTHYRDAVSDYIRLLVSSPWQILVYMVDLQRLGEHTSPPNNLVSVCCIYQHVLCKAMHSIWAERWDHLLTEETQNQIWFIKENKNVQQKYLSLAVSLSLREKQPSSAASYRTGAVPVVNIESQLFDKAICQFWMCSKVGASTTIAIVQCCTCSWAIGLYDKVRDKAQAALTPLGKQNFSYTHTDQRLSSQGRKLADSKTQKWNNTYSNGCMHQQKWKSKLQLSGIFQC